MGKAENIKRAKKLKEAKRKREHHAIIAAGLGPASKEIQQRNKELKIETQLNTGPIKYSELLKQFIQPIMNKTDDIIEMKAKYSFAVLVWNAAIAKEKSDEIYLSIKESIESLYHDDPELVQLFDEMTKRKQEYFSQFTNFITDYEIKKIRGLDYDLSVASTPTINL